MSCYKVHCFTCRVCLFLTWYEAVIVVMQCTYQGFICIICFRKLLLVLFVGRLLDNARYVTTTVQYFCACLKRLIVTIPGFVFGIRNSSQMKIWLQRRVKYWQAACDLHVLAWFSNLGSIRLTAQIIYSYCYRLRTKNEGRCTLVAGPRSLSSLWIHVFSGGYPLVLSLVLPRKGTQSLVPGPFPASDPMSFLVGGGTQSGQNRGYSLRKGQRVSPKQGSEWCYTMGGTHLAVTQKGLLVFIII